MADIGAPVRINGALMGNYVNSKVILIGLVSKLDPDGKKATLKTTDERYVQIIFPQPINFNLEQNSLVEAYGTVIRPTQLSVEQFVHFAPDVAATFDTSVYNQFIQYYLNHLDKVNITEVIDESNAEPVLQIVDNDFTIDWNKGVNTSVGDQSMIVN